MLKRNIQKKQVIPIMPFFFLKQGWGDTNPTVLTPKVDQFEGGKKWPQSKDQIIHNAFCFVRTMMQCKRVTEIQLRQQE